MSWIEVEVIALIVGSVAALVSITSFLLAGRISTTRSSDLQKVLSPNTPPLVSVNENARLFISIDRQLGRVSKEKERAEKSQKEILQLVVENVS